MKLAAKTLIPALFVSLLGGCASYTNHVDLNDGLGSFGQLESLDVVTASLDAAH
jgi:hypothetical protein